MIPIVVIVEPVVTPPVGPVTPVKPVIPIEINTPAELKSALLVGEVAGVAELLLPKAGVVVVARDLEGVVKLYIAALVIHISKLERYSTSIEITIPEEEMVVIIVENKATIPIELVVVAAIEDDPC